MEELTKKNAKDDYRRQLETPECKRDNNSTKCQMIGYRNEQ